ncbi:Erythroid differentiation-related factor 1 [Theobroma cacao]|uniref:Erythroid differentiation-related factor 1 n=1 Tax=Theobroma cacao TaxID=3641 RepID=A0A061FK10_THECC|nr:Erythroid differentiation-related factor 1 [Theobroma cacao]
MEKSGGGGAAAATPSIEGSGELQCVGKMEIVKPKPVGFLCGSIPVPTDKSFHAFNSALVPSSRQTVCAPRYRMLPTETDLNRPPLVTNLPEKVLPIGAVQSKATGDIIWEDGAVASNLSRKCEALAVSGLVEYGDEIDVIAPADILKQIFKIPYSKARLSIAVHRVGQTLVLNTGPDVEEGEKLVRRHSNQPKCTDQSLFLNFAMHSVRVEACDCPPTHQVSQERQSDSSVLPGGGTSHFVAETDDIARKEGFDHCSEYSQVKQDGFFWRSKKGKRNKSHDPIKKATHVGEKPRCSVQESEKHRRVGNNGFLRVLYWQFHNFRMLLGSDLLLFSNEKYAAVSLHLWDVTRQVTPLTWLEAWLDNVMASVPELAICYHQNGVVQGYELLKTDDIFLLKGVAEDGTPAFHPHVVQQNGLSVLRFLQENCKQDPGAYWLYKSAGEDVIQLFDLSVVSKNHSSSDCDDSSSSLPSLVHRGRSDSLFSLGTLLYRIAHRLSLSMATNNRAKCAKFFKKCLDFLDEPDHLVVRAFAHEQFARLILNYDEELDLMPEYLPIECEVTVTDGGEESAEPFNGFSESAVHDFSLVADNKLTEGGTDFHDLASEASAKMTLETNLSAPRKLITLTDTELGDEESVVPRFHGDENFMVYNMSSTSDDVVQPVTDPISSKLAAVHHVSQAIKSLRWMRQLQTSEPQLVNHDQLPSSMNFSVCACGDADCIEVCDIREWLPTSKLDHKLWKLVLLLGESYLALGQAYKEDGQLHQALKIVELACSVYGSMPRQLEDSRFISSIVKCSPSHTKFSDQDEKKNSFTGDVKEVKSNSADNCYIVEQFSSTYLFWANAWTLVGDVYVEFHIIKGKEISTQAERKTSTRELKMSSEVVKEVQRLKRKLGQYNQNCTSCSLVNCSCQSDRASSGNSASSSGGDTHAVTYSRKHGKRYVKNRQSPDSGQFWHNGDGDNIIRVSNTIKDEPGVNSLATTNSEPAEASFEVHGKKSKVAIETEISLKETPKLKDGGIFKYLRNTLVADAEHNLLSALSCYEEAIKALGELPSGSADLQSVLKKKGWVCNELGRNRLELKELNKAELAFADAINAFREALDYTNIILIYCNLGHGRRALAEEMVTKMEGLKLHEVFLNAYKQALETAKLEYSESLRYYGAAKSEMNAIMEEVYSVSNSLKNEVCTQFAHTYLRLGMLLAREDITAEVYENGALEDISYPRDRRARKKLRKHEITANEAIMEASSVYELLGELRKQEAAYTYFQLACYQRDCCLKFFVPDHKKSGLPKGEKSVHQRVKQFASLADRNWQKAIDFYGPQTHPSMYLTILIEKSSLSLSLSSSFQSNMMLESALSRLLEGRHVSEAFLNLFTTDYPELHARFWSQLQTVLKKMLAVNVSVNSNKTCSSSETGNKSGDGGKLRELYKMALKSNHLGQLHAMYTLWSSS